MNDRFSVHWHQALQPILRDVVPAVPETPKWRLEQLGRVTSAERRLRLDKHSHEGAGSVEMEKFAAVSRPGGLESQNHLRDAVDKGYITEDTRLEHEQLAETALEEVTGLMEGRASEYLLRPRTPHRGKTRTPNPERRTTNQEPNLNTNRAVRT